VTSFQSEKQLVAEYFAALDAATAGDIARVMARYCSSDYRWRGCHPFDEIAGIESVAARFWEPLRGAIRPMQRRQDIYMAGLNALDDGASTWVVSMGHLVGLFDAPWLGIPATGKMAFLRYCEFNRVADGRIAETALFFDIPHLMIQAGLNPFPPQTAAHLVQPGPMTHDGLMTGDTDPEEGRRTLAAIDFMIAELRNWQEEVPLEQELRRSWHEDMIWWGPAGIGATYTIERYAQQHSGAFRAGFANRQFLGHVAKVAEGSFGGFFGWPNLRLTPTGGFMGMPGTGKPGEMRVVDIYRRSGDKLAENWVFIDLLHFWMQQGVDILGRTTDLARR